MKTTYYLVAAAAVAAAGVTLYSRLSGEGTAAPQSQARAAEPPKDIPRLELPPVSTPPDDIADEPRQAPAPISDVKAAPLPAIPVGGGAETSDIKQLSKPDMLPVPPVVSASASFPVAQSAPVPPLTVPVLPTLPVAPVTPVTPVSADPPVPPVVPPAPVIPAPPSKNVEPPMSSVVPPVPVTPIPLPTPTPTEPPVATPAVPPVKPITPPVSPVIPAPTPTPAPSLPLPAPTPTPVVPVTPPVATPPVPTTPAPPPVTAVPVPPVPAPPPPITKPTPLPLPKPTPVVPPSPPTPSPSPVLQPPVSPAPAPNALPPLAGDSPRVSPEAAEAAKYVVLKGDKLIEVSGVAVNGDTVTVRHGALDRPFHKSQVQFVASSKDEVYKFMLAKVPANDVTARLSVARWCMYSGMREQALAEAREVQKLQPANAPAAEMIRSLDLSLRQFPPANAPKMSAPEQPAFPTELREPPAPIPPAVDPEPDVAPEAALVFGTRVQPFLANQCVDCHANPEYAGKFKLARVTPADAGVQATRANLRAVADQLKKDDPAASPLLAKALAAHGGMKQPAISGRQSPLYRALESWAVLAIGAPVAVQQPILTPAPVQQVPAVVAQPVPQPPVTSSPAVVPVPVVEPVLPPAAPVTPTVVDLMPPAVPPVVTPPVVSSPMYTPTRPTAPPVSVPTPTGDPLLPPPVVAPPAPVLPSAPLPMPVLPQSTTTPEVLPPMPMLPSAPAPKPVSPADAGVKPVLPLPPATSAPAPKPAKPMSNSQFGTAQPPKPPVTGPSGDEFDPSGFNQPK